MSQPQWKTIANLGDVNPIDHGGIFLKIDETGVYPPELEILETPIDDGELWDDETGDYGESVRWEVSRFVLERCTYINGTLSDNKFHPECPAWFDVDSLSIAVSADIPIDDFRAMLCSEDALQRAQGYLAIVGYHGVFNFDQYPLTLSHSEVLERYPEFK